MALSDTLTKFFNFITGKSDQLVKSGQGRIVDEGKAQSVFAKYKTEFEKQVDKITDDLISQHINARQWKALVMNEIRYLMITSAAIGAGGLGMLGPKDIAEVDNAVAKQSKFLDGFASQIEKIEPGGLQFGKLKKRTVQYFGSGRPLLEKVIARSGGRPDLPFYPAQGTDCGNNCGCSWKWKVVNIENGDYDVFWTLADLEHCETCNERARVCNPLQIRGGTLITDISSPKLFSEFNE